MDRSKHGNREADTCHVYLHKNCFDGVASAAVASWLIIELGRGHDFEFEAVDYDEKNLWRHRSLASESCVVDFLYHPGARYWWDHHPTAFVDSDLREHYEQRASNVLSWDAHAPSCAGLIARCARSLGHDVPGHLREAVLWADTIDSASYESVESAVAGKTPAQMLARSLRMEDSDEYHGLLVAALRDFGLEGTVGVEPFRERIAGAQALYEQGLEKLRARARLSDGVVVYELPLDQEIIDGMMPYYLFPNAKYSVGLVKRGATIKVAGNANPWITNIGPPIGELFEPFGGGGHRDVGAVILRTELAADGRDVLEEVRRALTRAAVS